MTATSGQKIPGATYATFKDLFSEGRSFEVPDFQRAYDWEEDQRKDLFGDIKRLEDLVANGREAILRVIGNPNVSGLTRPLPSIQVSA